MSAAQSDPIDIGDAVELEQAEYDAEQEAEASSFDDEPEPAGSGSGSPEPEPEPEPASDAAAEAAMSELDKAGDAWTKKAKRVVERAHLGLVECPVCPVPGFVPDMPRLGMPPEQLAVVLAILGAEPAAELPPHPNLYRCDTCDGYGMLPTGSRREGFHERQCPKCAGNGYLDRAQEEALAAARPPDVGGSVVPLPIPAPPTPAAPVPGHIQQGGHTFYLVPGGSADPYGRLPGHPLWGHDPSEGGY